MENKHAKHGCFKIGCGLMVAIFILGAVSLTFLPRRTFNRLFGHPPTKDELTAKLGGERVAAVLAHPDRVDSILLNSAPEGTAAHNFPVASDEKPVEPAIASEIATILLSPELHRESGRPACIPVYGIRTSYFANDDRVDIYFCFECAVLETYLNERHVGGLNFPFSYRRLITTVQKIYPDNAKLTDLARQWRD